MKVIKSGDGRTGWAKEFKCTGSGNGNGGCSAILLVEQGDLYRNYNEDTDHYATFTCPECGCKTNVDVPSSVEIGSKVSTRSRDWRD